MSADNYWEVRIHPLGGFTYVMGFDSQPGSPIPHVNAPQFADVWTAWHAANADSLTEYGVSFHPECGVALRDAV